MGTLRITNYYTYYVYDILYTEQALVGDRLLFVKIIDKLEFQYGYLFYPSCNRLNMVKLPIFIKSIISGVAGETLSIFWRTSINFNNGYKIMKNYNHINIYVIFDIQLHKKVAVRKKNKYPKDEFTLYDIMQ